MINLSKTLISTLLILGINQQISAQPTSNLSNFKSSWLAQALKLQREIDVNVPLNKATFLATHNSYNSKAYQIPLLRYIDPNQTLSVYEQLEAGVRSVEFDAHWTLDNYFSKDILLCHARGNHLGCSAFDRKISEGLQEIRRWLIENPNELVMLYIERHLDGHEPRMAQTLDLILGEFIFKPESVRDKHAHPKSCVPLPTNMSKAEILKTGKQLIVVVEGCDGENANYSERDKFHQEWNDFVFAGIGDAATTHYQFMEGTPKDFPGPPSCGTQNDFKLDPEHTSLWRVYEDRTKYGNLPFPTKKIDEYVMMEMVECGVNWQTLDMLEYGDARMAAAIWSWEQGYPKEGNGECAVYKPGSGIVNTECNSSVTAFACQNKKTDEFTALTATGMFRDGKTACSSMGSDWRFAVPVNGAQMSKLQDAALDQEMKQVWVNYQMNKDGKWLANK